jgi:hypothetical protein
MTTPVPDPDIAHNLRRAHSPDAHSSSARASQADAREDSATPSTDTESASITDADPNASPLTAPHVAQDAVAPGGETQVERPREHGGQAGPEPTRYGDWEKKGRCTDF